MIRRTYGGVIACAFLVACLFCVKATTDAELTFVPDPGVRVDRAGLASPSYDEDTGFFYLYYDDEESHRQLVTTSQDGLIFGPGAAPTEWLHDPRILLMPQPDAEERAIYRRYIRQPDSTFISESSPDGRHFTRDEGIRYTPRPQDLPVGVYDHFADSQGGIVLLYIGDMYGVNNIRRAYSAPGDNGWIFRFENGNPLNDADLGGGSNSYVDQKSILLPDGRRRLFVMKQGSIYSFISRNGGATFTLEPGVRLTPASFGDLKIRSLHDPWPVLLPDGRIRLYLHGFIDDGSSPRNDILSATQAGDDK
jgi:hypothetical protein